VEIQSGSRKQVHHLRVSKGSSNDSEERKSSMKKHLVVTMTTIALLAAAAAIGQVPRQQPQRPEAVLGTYLQLTPDQITAWQQIAKDTAAAVKPLAGNVTELEKQLHTALQASSPDAAAVGTLAISIASARDQIRTLHESAKSKRVGVLSPDQKLKYDAFEAAVAFLEKPRPRP
jgi:Spy/CpxP family protein refolding chaperone